MSGQGRVPKPDGSRAGHRKGPGRAKPAEVTRVEQRVASAEAPSALSPIAQQIWDMIVADMATLGHLREPDLVLVRGYCAQAGIMIAAEKLIDEYGEMMREPILAKNGDGEAVIVGHRMKQNPAVKMHGEALDRLRMLSNELALNPIARVRGNFMETATAAVAFAVAEHVEKKAIANRARLAGKDEG